MIAVVGHTGYVGSTVYGRMLAEGRNVFGYSSANISDMPNNVDLAVVCAPSAVKWYANTHPEEDAAAVKNLVDVVNGKCPRTIIHVSTIDVYGQAQMNTNPNELTAPVPDCAYGANRANAEGLWRADVVKILRLPGLYGPGLKKNVIFDLMNSKNLSQVNLNSTYQWADVTMVPEYIDNLLHSDIALLNVCPAPLCTPKLVYDVFPHLANVGFYGNDVNYCAQSLYPGMCSVAQTDNQAAADIYNFVYGRSPEWTALAH